MACSKQPVIVEHPSYQNASIYLQEHQVEAWQGGTLEDLVEYAGSLRDALDQCNLEKRFAREALDASAK